jgi:HrpA-like RNA helicase
MEGQPLLNTNWDVLSKRDILKLSGVDLPYYGNKTYEKLPPPPDKQIPILPTKVPTYKLQYPKSQANADLKALFITSIFGPMDESMGKRTIIPTKPKLSVYNCPETKIDISNTSKLSTNGLNAIIRLNNDMLKMDKTIALLPSNDISTQTKLIHLLDNPDYPIIIIKGDTGSGKTLMIPRQIARFYNFSTKIICTQSAQLHTHSTVNSLKSIFPTQQNLFDYQHKNHKIKNNKAKIIYSTDGLLLKQFINDSQDFFDYKAIIIDEIHERSANIDFLLLYIKKMLYDSQRNPLDPKSILVRKMKFIFMSATLDVPHLCSYFYYYFPLYLTIPGRTCHLDFISRPLSNPTKNTLFQSIISILEEIDLKIISNSSSTKICSNNILTGNPNKDVLVFLPKKKYISELKSLLLTSSIQNKIVVTELFSQSPNQSLAIATEPNVDKFKIILSTNIAQTNLTFKGIRFIIDSGLENSSGVDKSLNCKILSLQYITPEDAKQRAGRAGRLENGIVYQLFNSSNLLTPTIPLLDEPLDSNFRKILNILNEDNINHGIQFLYDLIDPPTDADIQTLLQNLTQQNLIDSKHNLTPLGKFWTFMNIDINICLTILYCRFLGVTDDTLLSWISILLSIDGTEVKDWIHDNAFDYDKYKDPLCELFSIQNLYDNHTKELNIQKYNDLQQNQRIITSKLNSFTNLTNLIATSKQNWMQPIIDAKSSNHKLIFISVLKSVYSNNIFSRTIHPPYVATFIHHPKFYLAVDYTHSLLTYNSTNNFLALSFIKKQNLFEHKSPTFSLSWIVNLVDIV